MIWPGDDLEGVRRLPAGPEPSASCRRTSDLLAARRSRELELDLGRDAPLGQHRDLRPEDAHQAGHRRRARPTASCATRSRSAGGRFLNDRDEELKRRVVFLGNELQDELFGDEDAGRPDRPRQPGAVHRRRRDAEEDADGHLGGPDADNAVIPLSTFRALFGRRYVSNLVVRRDVAGGQRRRSRSGSTRSSAAKYRFDPTDERALADVGHRRDRRRSPPTSCIGIEIFLGIIGALTLLIGGVGVANIMYAVVKHRTREIGVQMALGRAALLRHRPAGRRVARR